MHEDARQYLRDALPAPRAPALPGGLLAREHGAHGVEAGVVEQAARALARLGAAGLDLSGCRGYGGSAAKARLATLFFRRTARFALGLGEVRKLPTHSAPPSTRISTPTPSTPASPPAARDGAVAQRGGQVLRAPQQARVPVRHLAIA